MKCEICSASPPSATDKDAIWKCKTCGAFLCNGCQLAHIIAWPESEFMQIRKPPTIAIQSSDPKDPEVS